MKTKNKKRYRCGYEFAAGCLLRGKREELNPRRAIIDRDDFDYGVEQAIIDWKIEEEK